MMIAMRRPARSRARILPSLASGVAVALVAAAGCGPSDDGTGDCDGLVAGTLVISEVQADYDAPTGASGADTGHEWFEIHNASSAPIELAGVVLEHLRPTEPTGDTHVMRTATIPAGGYLVLGNTVAAAAPAHVDYGYGSDLGDLFNTGSGKLRLSCGSVVIDEAIYENVEPGRTRTLDGRSAPDSLTNDSQAAWCLAAEDAAAEYEPANFGTPGAPNQTCMNVVPGQCEDGGSMRDTVPPAPGDLVITELMPDPMAAPDATGEWVEVLVNRDVDLNDLGIVGGSGTPVVLSSQQCARFTAGSYVIFARSTDAAMNGGLPRVDAGSVSLTNTNGTIRLLLGATELDSITWSSARAGRSIQLSSGLTTPADNDVATNLCDGNAVYGAGDQGTPGSANRDCGAVTTGMCLDTGTGSMRPIVTPTAGQLVINEWMPNPMLVNDTAGEWFEVKATADVDLNGLQIGDSALVTAPVIPASGNCVRLATGAFALFAQGTDTATNGMLPPVLAAFPTGVDLVQDGGTVQVAFGGSVLHTVTWTTSTAARSIMLDTDGTQCTAPTGVAAYNGTDVGTPGTVNSPPECP